jgi:hypothetical protein
MAADFEFQPTQTPQITTGDWTTVNDPYLTPPPAEYNYPYPNGAQNPLGASYVVRDSSGRIKRIRYVRLSGTAAYSLNVSTLPGIVYWKDETFQVVTPTMSECVTTKPNLAAGFLVNQKATNGYFVFIETAGFLASCQVPSSTAVDDALYGAAGAFTMARTASGTAPTQRVAAFALTAISGGVSDVFVALESLGA